MKFKVHSPLPFQKPFEVVIILFYVDKSDPNPLYTIQIEFLRAVKGDKQKIVFVSPLSNTNEQSNLLESVILLYTRNKFVYQFKLFDITTWKDVFNQFIQ